MITLVLGGARSGKSRFAETLAAATGDHVTYVATASFAGDRDFEARVALHRSRRPAGWTTAEAGPDLTGCIEDIESSETLLIDSLGTWVAAQEDFAVDVDALCAAVTGRQSPVIVVSEEVGLGVHPSTAIGGRFRDVLGAVNQAVGRISDEAYLLVAGRALPLPPPWDAD